MILEATNPDPETLPTLGVWQNENRTRTYVSSAFPNVPDFTCDSWCYESGLDFIKATELGGGRVELRHRVREQPHVQIVTIVSPEPGVVEFAVRPEFYTDKDADAEPPDSLQAPNLCWQLWRAPGFASSPDPYPQFVKRCFIFTDDGPTFLHQTKRLKIPVRPADDPKNNPPWVQMYLPVWEPMRNSGKDWADYSRDRYLYPVIGTISRNGKYLTAIACNIPTFLCQAWHDCMHNNPAWEDEQGKMVWRLRIYAMENNPDELLRRVGENFSQSLKLKEKRVPAE